MTADLITGPTGGNHTVFLSGPPGAGKTTLAVRRLGYLLAQGIPAEQILILVPQRPRAAPYREALRDHAGSAVDTATIGGLARRTIELFWPLIAGPAGFAHPDRPPRFLTLETTQYYMNRIIEPFLGEGAFDGVTLPRARLVSQIVDNLDKAAAVGFPPEQIAERLKGAWSGESARRRIYDRVQAAALAFRRACLEHNLLDWSLQITVFREQLLPLPQLRRYLLSGYRHLIADNVEEEAPVTHDLLRLWLPLCESALLVYDTDGGYRVFLGADPAGALALAELCRERHSLTHSYVAPPEMEALGRGLTGRAAGQADPRRAMRFEVFRYHPQMLDWVADETSRLVREEGLAPGEIAILAPFLSDALRFALGERLRRFGLAVRSHRPSRPLREEPAARCLLTLAKLAHPHWRRPPPLADVTQALSFAIAEMDPVRAHLLARIVYRVRDEQPTLTPFYHLREEMQERIGPLLGRRYDELRRWLLSNSPNLAHFLSRLFGEVLSQPGFGFHRDFDAGATTASLIESVQKFRQAVAPLDGEGLDLDREYVDMIEGGVVAAQYLTGWQVRPQEAVLLLPAYTFLMMNQPVTVQFWLDAGSRAWFERIYQPLTQPYVLRRDWDQDRLWTDEDEVRVRQEALDRLILGLTRRCRRRVYLAFSELSERGYEQQGPLRQAVQRLLRRGSQ